ncbi:MAG: GntR family transcriptional regulator [Acidobacteria bacterium]|nr:GntR family transcriptional regulator [Acidobacteriota bacterium]
MAEDYQEKRGIPKQGIVSGIGMLLNLTDLSNESLQGQIIRQIRAKILAGELDSNTDLPSIRKLASDQHISVITVQRAYETLEREGLIHSRRGKGFFVSEFSKDRRKELARERLREILEPRMKATLAEGLSKEDINKVISKILKEV